MLAWTPHSTGGKVGRWETGSEKGNAKKVVALTAKGGPPHRTMGTEVSRTQEGQADRWAADRATQ